MGGIVSSILGIKQPDIPGPSAAEKAAQRDQAQAAADEKAKADRIAALSARAGGLRKQLSYQDERRRSTLG